jgi:hypothetical protein
MELIHHQSTGRGSGCRREWKKTDNHDDVFKAWSHTWGTVQVEMSLKI